jgi:glycosyltransferase involved in cell wall biosynthesis
VLPAHGTFPELVADTGGGLLSTPGDPADLAAKIKQLLMQESLRESLGQRGYQAVHDRYHDRVMAEKTLAVYQHVLAEARATGHSSPSR